MTLDELNTVFDFAVSRSIQTNREDLPPWAHRRAGVRAVVEALRDKTCSNIKSGQSAAEAWAIFEEIFASDGVEAAGGSTTPSAQELPAIGGTGGTAPAGAPVKAGYPSQPRIVSAVGVGRAVRPTEGSE